MHLGVGKRPRLGGRGGGSGAGSSEFFVSTGAQQITNCHRTRHRCSCHRSGSANRAATTDKACIAYTVFPGDLCAAVRKNPLRPTVRFRPIDTNQTRLMSGDVLIHSVAAIRPMRFEIFRRSRHHARRRCGHRRSCKPVSVSCAGPVSQCALSFSMNVLLNEYIGNLGTEKFLWPWAGVGIFS